MRLNYSKRVEVVSRKLDNRPPREKFAEIGLSFEEPEAQPASPREWWVSETPNGKNISGRIDLFTAVKEQPQNPPWVHVIEKAVFDAALERITRLEAALERAKDFINRVAGPIGSGCDIGSRQHMAQTARKEIEKLERGE